MKIKLSHKVLITLLLFLSCLTNSANAKLVTIGALSSNDDGSTSVIADSLNNLEWLRWDELADLTYAETLIATSVTGSHAGWIIANANEANLFINALFNDTRHACGDNDTAFLSCGDTGAFSSSQYTALLGDSLTRGTSSVDAAWFYDDEVTDGNAGVLSFESGSKNEKFNSFGNIALTDTYAHTNDESVGWLMYRPAVVTEPATLTILMLGIIFLYPLPYKIKDPSSVNKILYDRRDYA